LQSKGLKTIQIIEDNEDCAKFTIGDCLLYLQVKQL